MLQFQKKIFHNRKYAVVSKKKSFITESGNFDALSYKCTFHFLNYFLDFNSMGYTIKAETFIL